jgi:UDP-N-acetylmuramyl pentapeptide phosphotransferase/UDP-N-acetylglucosamine-1-phosphate transferase
MKIENLFKIFLGLVFLAGAVFLAVLWWNDFLNIIKGGLPWVVALVGVVFLLIGFEKD